jgi:hypothetical protein
MNLLATSPATIAGSQPETSTQQIEVLEAFAQMLESQRFWQTSLKIQLSSIIYPRDYYWKSRIPC